MLHRDSGAGLYIAGAFEYDLSTDTLSNVNMVFCGYFSATMNTPWPAGITNGAPTYTFIGMSEAPACQSGSVCAVLHLTDYLDGVTTGTRNLNKSDVGSSFYNTPYGNFNTVSAIGGVALASAVPEPETNCMFVAGLGLIGFMARRRKQQLAA